MFFPSGDMIILTLGTQDFFTNHFHLLFVLDPEKFITFSYVHDTLFAITIRFYSVYSIIHLINIYCAR